MFRMFWKGGWGQGLFHKHFFYFVCVEYKDYTLTVKNNNNKVKETITTAIIQL